MSGRSLRSVWNRVTDLTEGMIALAFDFALALALALAIAIAIALLVAPKLNPSRRRGRWQVGHSEMFGIV